MENPCSTTTVTHPDEGHYRVGVFTAVILVVVMVVYLVNGVVIMAFTAAGDAGDGVRGIGGDDYGVEFRVTDGLQPSRVLHSDVSGYVNVADPEPVAYLDRDRYARFSGEQRKELRDHESFHVVQKRLVADRSGGYPSVWNPVLTARYYRNFRELDRRLVSVMPEPGKDLPLRAGLETSADCWVQLRAVMEHVGDGPVTVSKPSYISGRSCSTEQLTVVMRMRQGVWPE